VILLTPSVIKSGRWPQLTLTQRAHRAATSHKHRGLRVHGASIRWRHEQDSQSEARRVLLTLRRTNLVIARDSACSERNFLVSVLAEFAKRCGYRTGVAVDPSAHPGFQTVIYIDLPTRQVSWHISDSGAKDIHLEPYPGTWDGHTSKEKYARFNTLAHELRVGAVKVNSQ